MTRRTTWWLSGLPALVGIAAAMYFLAEVGEVVELLLVSALLAYVMDPAVRALEARGLGRTAATTVVFAGTLTLIVLLFIALLPVVFAQFRAIQHVLTPERVGEAVAVLERWLAERLAFLGQGDVSLAGSLREFALTRAGAVLDYVPGVMSLLGDMVLIPFLLFFMLKDGPALKKTFVACMPNRYFEFSLTLLHKVDIQLGNFLRGQLIATLIVIVLSTLALWLLDVDYYLLIGPLAGLTNLIPYIGPLIGIVFAVVVALLGGGTAYTALAIVIAFTVIQLIDNVLVNPLVVARNVELHPVVVLLVVIIGGHFFGIIGLLLAVPAAAVFKVVIQETARNARRYRFQ